MKFIKNMEFIKKNIFIVLLVFISCILAIRYFSNQDIYGMIIWILIGLLNSITLVRKYLRR